MAKPRKPTATIRALMDRGFDSDLAEQLATQGYTLEKLKQTKRGSLISLGISMPLIDLLHSESRPPIPDDTLVSVLHCSRWTCCVCCTPSKPVIVHHIIPWNESHSHEEENLVVLCLEHHAEAHTHHDLSLNLTPERIRGHKQLWLAEVQERDVAAITRPCRSTRVTWDYFNHSRIIDLIATNGRLQSKYGNELFPITGIEKQPWMYAGDIGVMSRRRSLFTATTIDIMREWRCSSLNALEEDDIVALLKPGSVVALRNPCTFVGVGKGDEVGPGQTRRVTSKFLKYTFRFTIDAWEATSASAWHSHLTNEDNCEFLSVLLIRSVARGDGGKVSIGATCIAIGVGSSGSGWYPTQAEPLPKLGVPADGNNAIYWSDPVSKCDLCDGALGVVMYDAGVQGRGAGFICEDCFGDVPLAWATKYERTLASDEPRWVLVERNLIPDKH